MGSVVEFCLRGAALAGAGVWTPAGGPKAPAAYVQVDPADPETLYVQDSLLFPGSLGALWKSTDGGATWRSIQEEIGGAVALLELDPLRPGRERWARRHKGLPGDCSIVEGAEYCPRLYALTSDPRDHNRVLLAFGGDGFYLPGAEVVVSTDGGTTWHRAAQSPPVGVTALAAVGPRGNFLAGTVDGKIYQSVDGGEHWTAFGPGLPVQSPIRQLLRQPRDAWYAVTEDRGVFRSADGRIWSDISAGLPDLTAPLVVLDPERPDHLFAAVRGQGLWSWTP